MQKQLRIAIITALLGAFALGSTVVAPAPGGAEEGLAGVSAVRCPVLRLKHWKASTQQEKMAFLFGFATMLEMEKEWQGEPALPINKSINNSWVRGLSGKSLGDLSRAIDGYVERHPDEMERSVLKILGRMYVGPVLTPAERKMAGDRYEEMKK